MNVTFYSGFSKRRNSTKRPTGGTTKSVVLKENTSLMRPAFVVSSVTWTWNYCTAWQNYYYITDIVAEANGLFRVECELDVMATFKDSIGAYTTLISRAASDQNYDVIDNMYPSMTRPITKRVAISNPGLYSTSRAAGCYVVGVVGGNGQEFFVLTPNEFFQFLSVLMPPLTGYTLNDWLDAQITQAPAGGLASILQNIVLLKWLPLNYSLIASKLDRVTSCMIGNFIVSGVSLGRLYGDTTAQILSTAITFPDRDDNGARGRWLYTAPFANYSVYIPPFGLISIDSSYITSAGRQLVADIMAEYISGTVTLRLYYSTSYSGPKMIGVYNANISQDLKAGGSGANMISAISGAIGAIGAIATENYGALAASIASAGTSMLPQSSVVGGGVSGPTPDLGAVWYAYATYFEPIEENRTELGRPLAEVKTISSLSGFVQCANAQLALAGHEEEMVKVNGILNSGFFYE